MRSTEEQAERKRLERDKKLKMYKYAMGETLRRVASKEYDATGAKLSEELLSHNGDIQTLWNYRKRLIEAAEAKAEAATAAAAAAAAEDSSTIDATNRDELTRLFKGELALTEMALKANHKSYPSWFHRQWCMLRANSDKWRLGDSCVELSWPHELQLCNAFLNADERNFHCWSHRYFVVANGNIAKLDELAYTYDKISANLSNYSSWHYRSKLLAALYYENKIDAELFAKELLIIENAVFCDPKDQSAWIYQKWLFIEHQRSLINELTFDAANLRLHFRFVKDIDVTGVKQRAIVKLGGGGGAVHFKFEAGKCAEHAGLEWKCAESETHKREWSIDLSEWLNCTTQGGQDDDGSTMKTHFRELVEKLHKQNQFRLEVAIRDSGVSTQLLLERVADDTLQLFRFRSKFEMNNLRLDGELLESHLAKILELSEMPDLEPDERKWSLLTGVELMCALDFDKHKSRVLDHLDRLANDIDIKRKNFYTDLKRKLLLDNS